MAKSKPKKKHHYIPVFYLRGFTDPTNESCLWVYNKEGGEIFASTPEGIAYEKNYFSFIDRSGVKDSESFENWIAEIENSTSKIINKILSGSALAKKEKTLFSIFVSMMMLRTPDTRKNIEDAYAQRRKHQLMHLAANKKAFESMIKGYEEKTGKNIAVPVEELRKSAINFDENYTIAAESLASLQMIILVMGDLSGVFLNMKWVFIRATEENKFLTGDNPLFYGDPTKAKDSIYPSGLGNRNIQVTLPLSKEIVAFGSWKLKQDCRYIQGNNQSIKGINRNTVIATNRFVFASKKSEVLKNFVRKYQNSAPKIKIS